MTSKKALVDAVQAALTRVHAATYGYGLVGAHLHGKERKAAAAHLDAHRAVRDELAALLRDRGATPVGAEASYQLPFEVTGPATARRLAARLERAALGGHVGVVGAAGRSVRSTAIAAMQESASRQAYWSGDIDALPGLRR